jgi:glycosyltransferase involved in cell wall biosynthesis
VALRISAIVPATNRPSTLDACIAGIESAADGPEELIVIEEPGELGPAKARNVGASRASGDLLAFVDSDVSPCTMTPSRAFGRTDSAVVIRYAARAAAIET